MTYYEQVRHIEFEEIKNNINSKRIIEIHF